MEIMKADPRHLFAFATLLPVVPLVLGGVFGGPVVWLGLGCMTVLVAGLDRLIDHTSRVEDTAIEFPADDRLSVVLAGAHVLLLFFTLYGLGRGTALSTAQHIGLFMGVGLWLGQVSNSNAHELIHRPDRHLFQTGKWLFISLLFGHHTSAHRKVHHRFVGTPDDPNTAQLGESFYGFAARAWPDGFAAGWQAERADLCRTSHNGRLLHHPYTVYVLGSFGCLALAGLIGGGFGLLWYLALALFAQAQLLMSDYVQHYGLERRRIARAQLEPVGPQHSWNASQVYSAALMLNAPRHSDHHAHPAKPYPTLDLGKDVPLLPRSLPVMGMIALYPPAWRRLMDKRAKAWRNKGDIHHVSVA